MSAFEESYNPLMERLGVVEDIQEKIHDNFESSFQRVSIAEGDCATLVVVGGHLTIPETAEHKYALSYSIALSEFTHKSLSYVVSTIFHAKGVLIGVNAYMTGKNAIRVDDLTEEGAQGDAQLRAVMQFAEFSENNSEVLGGLLLGRPELLSPLVAPIFTSCFRLDEK